VFRFRLPTLPACGAALAALTTLSAAADHAALNLGGSAGSPINTESALTLPAGRWSLGWRSEYVNQGRLSDARLADTELHSTDGLWVNALVAAYGISDDFTIALRLPYIQRFNAREADHDHADAGDHGHDEEGLGGSIVDLGDPDGLGDATLFGQYRWFRAADDRTHLALLAGIKAPTGETGRHGGGERLETEFQPGSGSWDSLLGVAATHIRGALSWDASLLYAFVNSGAQSTNLGDVFSYDLAASYRLGGDRPPSPYDLERDHNWDLVMELNGEWRDREQIRGEHQADTGGNLIYLSPGVRYLHRAGWSLALALGVPVIQDLNGTQVEPDYRVVSTLHVAF
jgi:hypothetical protein